MTCLYSYQYLMGILVKNFDEHFSILKNENSSFTLKFISIFKHHFLIIHIKNFQLYKLANFLNL